MRTLLALVLVVLGCGASGPSGPVSGDAGADTSNTSDASDSSLRRCPTLGQVFIGGRCVAASDSSCAGRACPTGQNCFTVFADDGGDDQAVCMAF